MLAVSYLLTILLVKMAHRNSKPQDATTDESLLDFEVHCVVQTPFMEHYEELVPMTIDPAGSRACPNTIGR